MNGNVDKSSAGVPVMKINDKKDGSSVTTIYDDGSIKTVSNSTGATQAINNLEIKDKSSGSGLASGATQQMQGLHVDESDIQVDTVDNETESKIENAKVQKQLEIEKMLEEKSIKDARKNAMGHEIRSAEPYNYFQDMTKLPFGYMTLAVGVFFNSRWNPTSIDIKNMIEVDLGFKDQSHEKIAAVGRNNKHITLTAKTKEIKREIYEILTQAKFREKYRCVSFEEPETTVMMNYVPFQMPDEVLEEMLGKYGEITEHPVHMKCDLGFPNLQRKVIMKLKYDMPSYLRVQGYTTQPRYEGQPSTCRLCGERSHMAIDCELNTRKPRNENRGNQQLSKEPEVMEAKSDGESMGIDAVKIIKAVEDNIALFGAQQGSSVGNPALLDLVNKQIKRFEECATKRQQERYKQLQDESRFRSARNNRNRKRDRPADGQSPKGPVPSYRLPLNGSGTGSNPKLPRVNGNGKDRREENKKNRKNDDHDYYDGDKNTSNRFDVLRQDLDLSSDNEEHRKYVQDRNSIYM